MPGQKDVSLSAREMEVLALAWHCMDTQPKIDMQKLASLTGYTPGSASVTMGTIKRKLKLLGATASSAPRSTPAPKKSGSAPRRAKTGAATQAAAGVKRGAEGGEAAAGGKRVKREGEKMEEEEEEGEEGVRVKEEELGEGEDVEYAMLEGLSSYAG